MFEWNPQDLAPGDLNCSPDLQQTYHVYRVQSASDPLFERGYMTLWDEFGAKGELEQRPVLAERLGWEGAGPLEDYSLWYEMIVVLKEHLLAGVIDYTAIVRKKEPATPAIVHLSHIWIAESYRRSGLGGWLRAFPVQTARQCLEVAGRPQTDPIILVGEMEHPTPDVPLRLIRLMAFEKAGFMKIDPAVVPYHQPDFRAPSVIDTSGGPRPLPFGLVIRQVGREQDSNISGRTVRQIVADLYHMYSRGMRPDDMQPLWTQLLRQYPHESDEIKLIRPTHSL